MWGGVPAGGGIRYRRTLEVSTTRRCFCDSTHLRRPALSLEVTWTGCSSQVRRLGVRHSKARQLCGVLPAPALLVPLALSPIPSGARHGALAAVFVLFPGNPAWDTCCSLGLRWNGPGDGPVGPLSLVHPIIRSLL